MRFDEAYDQQHSADLLPAYLNGTLDRASSEQMQQHLLHCAACREELAAWQSIQGAAQAVVASTSLPSASILESVWADIDAPQPQALLLSSVVMRLWWIFRKQIPIIHKSIWIATPLVILFGGALALYAILLSPLNMQSAVEALTLVTSITAATGLAFIFGLENDAALEITLSTPTSIRLVMLCRLLLVLGYNILLASCASAALALAHGGSFWEIVQTWLGPMLLLSSITLTLSTIIGSGLAVFVGLLLELLQTLPDYIAKHIPLLQFVSPVAWPTSPLVLFLAVLFIIFAVLYAPRHPRLST